MNKNWKVILTFIGIFAAGAVTGILVAPSFFRNVAEWRAQHSPARSQFQGQLGRQFFSRITEQLDLTPEQREKIKPIEQRMIAELRRLRRETQRETELVIKQTQEEISAVLTPEQRVQFEERIAKGRERIKKFLQEQEQRNRRDPAAPRRQREDQPPK